MKISRFRSALGKDNKTERSVLLNILQQFPQPLLQPMKLSCLLKSVFRNLAPLIFVGQIIFAFLNQFVLTGVSLQICSNLKILRDLTLKICQQKAAAGKDIPDAQRESRLDGFGGHIQVDFAEPEDFRHVLVGAGKPSVMNLRQQAGIAAGIEIHRETL